MTKPDITIKRAQHGIEENYFLKARATSQDEDLSYEASGMLDYLLSKPNNWLIRPNDLQRKGTGRDRVYRILNELISARYIERKAIRNEQGHIIQWLYLIHERPYSLLPEKPDLAKPEEAKPDLEKPHAYRIQSLENTDSTDSENKQTTTTPLPPNHPDVVVVSQMLSEIGIKGKEKIVALAQLVTPNQCAIILDYARENNLKPGWIIKEIKTGEYDIRNQQPTPKKGSLEKHHEEWLKKQQESPYADFIHT